MESALGSGSRLLIAATLAAALLASLGTTGAFAQPSPAESWNRVFSASDYVYGKEPNAWFAAELARLKPGRLLLPAEGEGRNAVFAAGKGWSVDAFDISPVARDKALRLAKERGVTIDYRVADFADPGLPDESYDMVALIYAHMPPPVREKGLEAIKRALKPGGVLLIEGFSHRNLALPGAMGPKSTAVLYDATELRKVLAGFYVRMLDDDVEVVLKEGAHDGRAVLIRMLAVKRK